MIGIAGRPKAPSKRTRAQRRFIHHSLIGITSVGLTFVFMQLFPQRDLISRVSIGTAYPALFLTAATMVVGPLNVLLRRANPISFDLRRDLGIWAGITALAHTAVGLNVHLRGKMWLYFVDTHNRLRHDAFGFGNYTGSIAALLFILLLALSNDMSLRKLGGARWKTLQRWAYAAIALTGVHAVLYQNIEKRILPFVVVLFTALGVIFVFQLAGVWNMKER